jgi:hypothetical protein
VGTADPGSIEGRDQSENTTGGEKKKIAKVEIQFCAVCVPDAGLGVELPTTPSQPGPDSTGCCIPVRLQHSTASAFTELDSLPVTAWG